MTNDLPTITPFPFTKASLLQFLLAKLGDDALYAARDAGHHIMRTDSLLLALCTDGSILFGHYQLDPEDENQEIWQTASFPELQSFKSFLVGEFSESPELATLHDTLGDEDCGILAQACDVVLLNSGLEAGHA